MAEGLGPQSAMVDPAQGAGELDVHAVAEQLAGHAVEVVARQRRHGDDRPVGLERPHDLDRVLRAPEDEILDGAALGLLLVAAHAPDPDAELGVLADQLDELGRLVVGADHDHAAASLAGPTLALEPDAEPAAPHEEEQSGEEAAEEGLDALIGEVEDPERGQAAQRGEDGVLADPGDLGGADRVHARQVEAELAQADERADGGEGDDDE